MEYICTKYFPMKYYFLIPLFALFFACDQDNSEITSDCLGEVDTQNATYCSDEQVGDKYCDVRYAGKYSLSEASKNAAGIYCESEGTEIVFNNSAGEELLFTIGEKSYREMHRFIDQGPCPEDSLKVLLDCIDAEMASLVLVSDTYTFKFEFTSMTDQKSQSEENVGDFLLIFRKVFGDLFYQDFKMVLDQRSLSYDMEDCLKLYESIDLNGDTYFNVISYKEDESCYSGRYYFTSDHEFIAFNIDGDGLWTVKM